MNKDKISKILLCILSIYAVNGYTSVEAGAQNVTTRVSASNDISNPYHSITYSTDGNGYGAVQPTTGTLSLYLTDDSSINVTAAGGSAAASGLRLRNTLTNIDVMSGNLNIFVNSPATPTNNDVVIYGIFADRSGSGYIKVGSGTTVDTVMTLNSIAATGYSANAAGIQNNSNDQDISLNGNINMNINAQSSKNTLATGISNSNSATNSTVNINTGAADISLNATTQNSPSSAAYTQTYALVNFGSNQSINIDNTAQIYATADTRLGGASSEAIAAINSSLAGNSNITVGNNANIELNAYGGTDVTRASLASNNGDMNNVNNSRNLYITFGDNTSASVNAESTTSSPTAVSVAINRQDTYNSSIVFGSGAQIDLTAKSKDGVAYATIAENASSINGGNDITFADNGIFNVAALSTGMGNATVYGASNRGNNNNITFGDNTIMNLQAEAQGTGNIVEATGAINNSSSNLATISFGNNTVFDLQIRGGTDSALIYAVGNMGDATSVNMNQNITLSNNTYIRAQSLSDAAVNQIFGVSNRNDSFNSHISLGDNTSMDLTAQGEGLLSVVGIYSGSRNTGGNTVFVGDQTTITANATATGLYSDTVDSAVVVGVRNEGIANTIVLGDNTVIDVTSHATSGVVKARGLQNRDANQEIWLQGGAIITASATSALGVNSSAYAIYSTAGTSDSSNIWLNVDKSGSSYGKNVQLTGDILAQGYGNIYLSLPTEESFLQGTVIQNDSGKVYMSLDNGAKWHLSENSYDASGKAIITLPDNSIRLYNLQVGSHSTIDLTSDDQSRLNNWRTLSFNGAYSQTPVLSSAFDITGSGNTFVLNSDIANNNADKIVISSLAEGTNYIKINNDSIYANGGKENAGTKTLVVQTLGDRANFQGRFVGTATERGILSWTPNVQLDTSDNNWYIIGANQGYSQTVLASIAYMRLPNSTLIKRMGELRNEEKDTGLWLRIYGGESNLYNGAGNQTHKAIQGGMDKVRYEKGRKVFTGMMVESMTAGSSWQDGSRARSSMFDVGAYQSSVYDDGRYYDLVARFYNLNHHISMIDSNLVNVNGQYRNWALEGSIEYGKRKELGSGYFWIPQAQLTYKYIKGANYTTSNAISFEQKDVNSLIGRLGVSVGRKYKDNSQLYLEAGILREFLAQTNVYIKDGYGQNGNIVLSDKETWYSLALGYTKKVNSKTDLYFEIERTFGSRNDLKWQGKIGARWSW